MESSVFAAFVAHGISAAREYTETNDVVMAEAELPRRLERAMWPRFRAVIDTFGTYTLNRKQDSQFEELIVHFLSTHGAAAVVWIDETTREKVRARIRKAIIDAQTDGAGVPVVAEAIHAEMSGAVSRRRARVIARTETHNAASYANHEVAKELDIPGKRKRWSAIRGPRTRKHHDDVNGQVVDFDADFIVPYRGIEYRMARPGDQRGGPANVINCRCASIVIAADDIVDE